MTLGSTSVRRYETLREALFAEIYNLTYNEYTVEGIFIDDQYIRLKFPKKKIHKTLEKHFNKFCETLKKSFQNFIDELDFNKGNGYTDLDFFMDLADIFAEKLVEASYNALIALSKFFRDDIPVDDDDVEEFQEYLKEAIDMAISDEQLYELTSDLYEIMFYVLKENLDESAKQELETLDTMINNLEELLNG